MRHRHGALGILLLYVILSQFAAVYSASNEAGLGFGTKRLGLSSNIPAARGASYEGWNVAGLGFLDRDEIAVEVGFYLLGDLDDLNYGDIRTVYAGYSKPSLRLGTFGIGIGSIEAEPEEASWLYPYLGYSREFSRYLSLGFGYTLEIPVNDKSKLNGAEDFIRNSIEQVGFVVNILDYLHLDMSVENRGYPSKIESVRSGAALILLNADKNSMFNSVILRSDIDTSLKFTSSSKPLKCQLHNLHLGTEMRAKYFSIGAGILKDLGDEDSPLGKFLAITVSIPMTKGHRPHAINFAGTLINHREQYFLTNGITFVIGESARGSGYMEKAEEFMSEYRLEMAAEYFEKSERFLIGEANIQKASERCLDARQMLANDELHYNAGLAYAEEGKIKEAIDELKRVNIRSKFYPSAVQKIKYLQLQKQETITEMAQEKARKVEQAKLNQLYQQATNLYKQGDFSEARSRFEEILMSDWSYRDSRGKFEICAKMIEAQNSYRQWQYNKAIDLCDQILKQYSHEPVVEVLRSKARGNMEYDNGNLQQAIDSWNAALELEEKLGIAIDSYILEKKTQTEERLAIEQDKHLIKQVEEAVNRDDYAEAGSLLSKLQRPESATELAERIERKEKAFQIYKQAEEDYQKEQYIEAERKLSKCLEIDPDHTRARNLLKILCKDLLSEVKGDYVKIYIDPEGKILEEIEVKLRVITNSQLADSRDLAVAYMYLGAIQVAVFKDEDEGESLFTKALDACPECSLPFDDTDIVRVFERAERNFRSRK